MTLLIQAALIAAVLFIVYRLVSQRGARTQAIRRLGMFAFAVFAVLSIMFPGVWQTMANLVGVGRGADLVLYGLVIAFLAFTMHMYLKFRDFETRYTRLARRIALDEADRMYPEVALGTARPPLESRSPEPGPDEG